MTSSTLRKLTPFCNFWYSLVAFHIDMLRGQSKLLWVKFTLTTELLEANLANAGIFPAIAGMAMAAMAGP